ncbi:aromatic acid exporter family protein [Microlunatus sp. Gsoil 973]|uniref:FUSC family protein n=1 Tax=Microlunatus sp. Gsoil 973 TaxID=2672569 RepID=UPI0012B4497B|nr:aromatic acid exporter family protein [Microlunatus sp. Gsoil 973]QGN31878.1 FUSC family protein [Microlunatus sp. Gsoil 973]
MAARPIFAGTGILVTMVGSRLMRVVWPEHPERWREVPGRLVPFGAMVLRLSLAAVVSYLLTRAISGNGPVDLTGPLTALLVLQASTLSTLRMGVVRVGAVLCGVLIAIFLSNWIGLTWWSLGAAIMAAIVAARLLRLGEQMLEAPISAMLILGVAHHDVAAYVRVINTLVGAGVGIAFGILFPTALAAAAVARSVRRVAEMTAAPLDSAAETLQEGAATQEQAQGWLDQARDAAGELASVNRSVSNLRERRRWNPRAIGTSDVVPVFDSGLETFDRSLLAIRALFTAMISELPHEPPEDQPEDQPDGLADPYGEDLRQIFSVVLSQTAGCLRAFGDLVVAEAEAREDEAEAALAEGLEYAGETRAMLAELMLVDPPPEYQMLRGSLVIALEHVLTELRLENRQRVRQARQVARLPVVVESVLLHPDRPYPRAVDMMRDRRTARSVWDRAVAISGRRRRRARRAPDER